MNSNWSYSPETPNLGQICRFLAPCDLEIWWMTFKNNRAPLLSNIKLYVSFHHHMWIQTGVTVRKRLSWVVTSVTLTFDLWPWPFAWTLPWSLVITPENFMMIRWWEHSQKGATDGQKIPFIELLGRSWKYILMLLQKYSAWPGLNLAYILPNVISLVSRLRPRQNGCHFADDILWILIQIHWSLFPYVQLIIFQHWFG